MGNLFGRPKPKSRVTEQDKAVLQLKQQRDKLKQYRKRIEGNLEKDRLMAKTLLKQGKKEKAKLLLRKKKFQEQLVEKAMGQLDNLERLIHDIEFAQIETQVIDGLKIGNECLKKMHELMTIEDVEKIMDETKEAVEYQQQIDEIIGGGLTNADEEDILKELDDIIQAEHIELPDVPTTDLPSKQPVAARKAKPQQREEPLLA